MLEKLTPVGDESKYFSKEKQFSFSIHPFTPFQQRCREKEERMISSYAKSLNNKKSRNPNKGFTIKIIVNLAALPQAFYTFIYSIQFSFQSLKLQNFVFLVYKKVSIENAKLFSKAARNQLSEIKDLVKA